MTVAERHEDILQALDRKLVREALDAVRIEARLRELVSDAIERAPAVAAWASGKVAVGRLGEPGNDGGGGGRPIHPPAHPGARP